MITAHATEWWSRHAALLAEPWIEMYWEDWQAPHRSHILLALALLEPQPKTLHEVGCAGGPNLRLIQEAFPQIALSGSEMVVAAGQTVARRLEISVWPGALPRVLHDTPKADVYLSSYTLAYLDPGDARLALERMGKLAQTMILMEPMPLPGQPEGESRQDLPEWRHEYAHLLPEGWHVAWRWPIIPQKENLNTLLIAQRG